MQHVLTLTSNPASPALDAFAVERAKETLRAADLSIGESDWLDPDTALDRECVESRTGGIRCQGEHVLHGFGLSRKRHVHVQ